MSARIALAACVSRIATPSTRTWAASRVRVLVRRGDDYVTLARPWSAARSAARSPYHRLTGTPDLDTTLKAPGE